MSSLLDYYPTGTKRPENKQDKLTYGQKKVQLSLEDLKPENQTSEIQARITTANFIDLLYKDYIIGTDYEKQRLVDIAIDELQNTLKLGIRALTYGHN